MTPKVFISYSWDNQAHKDWVRHLADQLIANGVDVVLDQYEVQSGDSVTFFMERAVADTDKVLLILTENYKTKADGRGGGVGYEYSMINAQWYDNQTGNNKFIPVLRGQDMKKSKPIFLQSIIHIDMSDDALFEEKFNELLHRVYDQPILQKPALGKRPDFANIATPTLTPTPMRIPVEQRIQDVRKAQAQEKENRQLRKPRSERQDRDSQQANQLRDLIAKGKTDTAIQQLRDLANQVNDSDYQTQVIMQATAYEQYQKSKRMGITSHSEQQVSLAKINNALLQLINEIP